MDRRNPDAKIGYINWPEAEHGWQNTGEGGTFVVAAFPCHQDDAFGLCCGVGNLCLVLGEELQEAWEPSMEENPQRFPLQDKWFPRAKAINDIEDCLSVPLLACVTLGVTGGSWYHEEAGCFVATEEHLTEDGRALMASLEKLYDRKADLLTFLDT